MWDLRILLLIISLGIPSSGWCQAVDTSRFKLWQQHDLLQWEDYRVSASQKLLKHGFKVNAVTSYQYIFVPKLNTDTCINLLTVFRKRNSWVKDTLHPLLLEHERIHFDIAELYARILRKAMFTLYLENTQQRDKYFIKIDSLFKAGAASQERYDQQTLYGFVMSRQHTWKDSIARELKRLHGFSFKSTAAKYNEYVEDAYPQSTVDEYDQ